MERWLTLLAALCTIVPVLYGGWVIFAKGSRPRLTYVIDPSRSVVADASLTSRLRVLLDDQDLRTRVYLSQVMIFNSSGVPVEPKDMLVPLTIDVAPPSDYIDVRIVKQSTRELNMNVPRDAAGRAPLPIRPTWQIMQRVGAKLDAAVLQIVHTGNPRITVDGSHRLQRELRWIPLDRDAKMAALLRVTPLLAPLAVLDLFALVWILFTGNRTARIAAATVFFGAMATGLWLVLRIFITPDLPLGF